jgi:hypothetical protein
MNPSSFIFSILTDPFFALLFAKNATHFARDRDALMIGGSSIKGFKMSKNAHFRAERPVRGDSRGTEVRK